jgi:hypothetical protein
MVETVIMTETLTSKYGGRLCQQPLSSAVNTDPKERAKLSLSWLAD